MTPSVEPPSDIALTIWAIGRYPKIPIDEARHNALRDAMKGVRILLEFEDKFAIVIDNLVEFEMTLLRISQLNAVRSSDVYDNFFSQKRDANRCLSNMLASCRQYVDQSLHHIEPLLADANFSFKSATSQEYDSSLSYRVMEALRNYVQHSDLGLHTMHVGVNWDEQHTALRFHTGATLDVEHLNTGGNFKATVLDELNQNTFQPDILTMLREYVSAFGRVHLASRTALAAKRQEWIASIKNAMCEYELVLGKKFAGLAVVRVKADNQFSKLLDVFDGPADRLLRMEQFNTCKLDLGKSYVSSQATPQKKKK